MKNGSTGRAVILLAVLLALAACRPEAKDTPAHDRTNDHEGEIEMDARYLTHFADHRRSSFQNADVRCSGEILWSRDIPAEAWMPQAIYLFGDRIVLLSRRGFTLFTGEGELLWHQEMMADSPIGLADSLIYYQDGHFRLSAVDMSRQQKMSSGYYPGPINEDYPVYLLWAGRKDFLYVVQFTGGAEDLPRKVLVKRTIYGNRLSEWTYEIEGSQTLLPLYIEEKEQVVVFAAMAHFISAADGKEISRRKLPIGEAVLASGCSDGSVLVSGSDEGCPAVAAFSAAEGAGWKWKGAEGDAPVSRVQPPIAAEGGRVLVLAGRDLIALQDGRKVWGVQADEAPFYMATAFAGGKIVAAAGTHILGYENDGSEIFDIEFEDTIVAPPVAAGDGTVYLLTRGSLMRVR